MVGHTPTSGVIWPRYDSKVVMIDTGISSHYGGHIAYLEITSDGLFAAYPRGKLPLPANDDGRALYLEKVIEKAPDNPYLQERLEILLKPAPVVLPVAENEAGGAASADAVTAEAPEAKPIPICGTSQ